MTDWDTRYRHR